MDEKPNPNAVLEVALAVYKFNRSADRQVTKTDIDDAAVSVIAKAFRDFTG